VDEDWVYNSSDIDNSQIVWARDMAPAANQELLKYFHNRHVWLAEPERSRLSAWNENTPEQPKTSAPSAGSSENQAPSPGKTGLN
jgi:hypothetical protein